MAARNWVSRVRLSRESRTSPSVSPFYQVSMLEVNPIYYAGNTTNNTVYILTSLPQILSAMTALCTSRFALQHIMTDTTVLGKSAMIYAGHILLFCLTRHLKKKNSYYQRRQMETTQCIRGFPQFYGFLVTTLNLTNHGNADAKNRSLG